MNFCMNLYELKHIGIRHTVGMHRAATLTITIVIFLYGTVSRSQPAP